MENASKALLMAGGVLIAVLTISLFVYMFTSASSIFQTEADVERTQEIEEYNKQYESYNRKLLRGTDLISLMNKVINNNDKYEEDPTTTLEEYRVTIKFKLVEDIKKYEKITYKEEETGLIKTKIEETNIESLKKGNLYKIVEKKGTAYDALFGKTEEKEAAKNDFKRRVFDCTGVNYNSYGRICELTYQERKIDYTEGF